MISQSDGWSRLRGAGVVNGRIRNPRFARVSQMILEATPLVPLECPMTSKQQEKDDNQDDSADLRDLKEIIAKVIDGRGVETTAEGNCVLLRYWQHGGVETKADEGVVDISLYSLERRVYAAKTSVINEMCVRHITHRSAIEFLMEDTVGSELFSWIRAFSKSVGMVMFPIALRAEMLN